MRGFFIILHPEMISRISSLYLLSILIILYLPNFQSIDTKAAQNLYLSIVNSIFFLAILIKQKKIDLAIFKKPILICFGGFLIVASLSTLWALNRIESLVRLTDLTIVFITLFLALYLIKQYPIKTNVLLLFVLGTLTLDIINSIVMYVQIESVGDYGFLIADELRGFWGNKNILAVAIAMRVPLILILFLKSNNRYLKLYILFAIVSSFYIILLLSARSVFVSITITLLFIAFVLLVKKYAFSNFIKNDLRRSFLYIIPIILSIILFRVLVNQDDGISIENRASTMINSDEDRSITERLRFYSQSTNSILSNPILGVGIGNWKIFSIKADSETMMSYVVPYFAHNDFLEVFAETGILGFLFYFMFIFFLFKLCLSKIVSWMQNKSNFESVLLCLPFIFYFIDLNLNFPLDRTAMQVLLIVYISTIFLHNYESESKE